MVPKLRYAYQQWYASVLQVVREQLTKVDKELRQNNRICENIQIAHYALLCLYYFYLGFTRL